MLHSLTIENIAVAKLISVDFDSGFSVITGETGAGKSILADCIGMLLGAKVSKDIVRTGEKSGEVSGIFDCTDSSRARLAELGVTPDDDGMITIVRTVSADGRSTARINRKAVPLSLLRDAAVILAAIHGQTDSHELSDSAAHIAMLDEYAETAELTAKFGEMYSRLSAKHRQIADLEEALRQREMNEDILKYQLREIEAAKLTDPEEEERLMRLRDKLKSVEHIAKYSSFVSRALGPGEKGASAAYLLEKSAAALRQLTVVMEDADELADRLDSYRYDIIDIAERAADILDDDDMTDPGRKLDAVETRLALIKKLRKKYGASVEDIIAKRDEIKSRLSDMASGDERMAQLEREYAALRREAGEMADVLTGRRKTAAEILSAKVTEALRDLDMPKVRFFVSVTRLADSAGTDGFDKNGRDSVIFTVSTNPGEPPKPMGAIASGGEISRIMLALKSTMTGKSGTGTVIFDEIDAGVSGATSERMGLMLREISRSAQVICITHSAQIAAKADSHFIISKNEVEGRARSSITLLDRDGRIAELSRIIGGIEITDAQFSVAREMLDGTYKSQ